MILEIIAVSLYIVFVYFKVFRGSYIWFDKNDEVKKRRKSKLWMILKGAYEYTFHTKEENRLEFFKTLHKFSPRYIRFKFWKLDYIGIYDPELAKKVLNTHLTSQRPFRNCLGLEKGLMSAEYHYWKMSRKLMNGAFNLNIIKGFIPIYSQYTKNIIIEMEEHLDGKDFDLLFPLAKLTASSIAAITLNVRSIHVPSYEKLIDSLRELLELTFDRMVFPPFRYDFIYKLTKTYKREQNARDYAIKFGDELITAAREKREKELCGIDENSNEIQKKDPKVEYIIDQLFHHEDKFTKDEIREHILVLLITASETSARFVGTVLLFLAIHQDIQEKVYNEISDVFNGNIEDIDYEKLKECIYLEMVLKETLRIFSSVPIIMREALDKFDIGIGKPIEKGAKIFLINYVLHRRKDIWGDNSNLFNPENFSPENVAKRDPYCYLPFGAGPRNCIGNRVAMISAKIEVLMFIFSYKFKTKIKESDIKLGLSLTSKLSVDYIMSIEKR